MLKRTLPDWNDEIGIADLASAIIARSNTIAGRFEAYGNEAAGATIFGRERTAVEAAIQGDVAPLAALLQDPEWDWLQPETRQLVSDILLGKRRRGRGRPKMAPEKRWAANKIHRARGDFNHLQYYLRRFYPEQSAKAVRARAIEIAAKQTGVEEAQLRRHLDRSQHSRHRIS